MTEQEFNLKNRITGAVILVVVSALLVSFLIQEKNTTFPLPTPVSSEFASKIIGSNDVSRVDEFLSENLNAENDIETITKNIQTPLDANGSATLSSHGEFTSVTNAGLLQPRKPLELVLERNTRIERASIGSTKFAELDSKSAIVIEKQRNLPAQNGARWILRVGAFKRKNNADRVVGQLTEAGYKTGQSNITGPSGQVIIRVWAGPFSNQKEALRAKGSINKQLGLNGFVSKLQS